jgi:hypothetical protein
MLQNKQGNALLPIGAKQHWRLLELMLQNPTLSTPLRTAINQHVDTVAARHQQGQRVAVPSSLR